MSAAPTLLALWLLAVPHAPSWLGPRPSATVQRVVTLAPSLTETVLALGKGQVLVGVSRFDEEPAVSKLPRVGGFLDPSVEAVLALKPDLVLVQPSPGNQRPVEKLAALGVPILVLPLDTVADVLRAFRSIGQALGAAAQGEALAERLTATRARVQAQAHGLPALKALFVYGFQPLVVAGPGSFADEFLTDVGARNVASQAASAYAVYSLEAAVVARPDVVVDASDSAQGKDRVRALPGLSEARWVKLPTQDLLHPGPKLAVGLEAFFKLLREYPRRSPALETDAGVRAP